MTEYTDPPDDKIPEDFHKETLWHLKQRLASLMHRHDDMAGLDEGVYTEPVKRLIDCVKKWEIILELQDD